MNFSQMLLNWYHKHGRKNLPWQKKNNIYYIWLSEIMLQQTSVTTVIPFFKRFIQKFKNIHQLAKASLNDILYLWSGLGYYKRAHYLYQTSQIIVKKYNQKFPSNIQKLLLLPGIGKSTAGAILSLSYNFCYPILDGNVKRILIRFYNIQNIKTIYFLEKKLWSLITNLLPLHHPGKFNQALMDLGSLICKIKKPLCYKCPLKKICIFYKKKKNIFSINFQKPKKKINLILLIIKYQSLILLIQQNKKNFWPNLFCFPMIKFFLNTFQKKNNLIFYKKKKILPFFHFFSHIKFLLCPHFIKISTKKIIKKKYLKNSLWFNLKNPQKIGLPTPIKKILSCIKNESC
ncbi:A/G-specific adenine glycosylase [Buchnera aphidicola]|uniref:Adenine DNA glycosylase n=1 Tax=Buchnera aphidicola subsp. Tuberolachnus salignus TaxID=98804 RepID=A0A170PCA6_BUCTT|nr:A/G-specific adenine glycosylase [Buchnera aphidicola]CUR53343.1 A/G-specific adenine glycosylase [Buchnera aphidicola (Tuberolachnus salignus)]